MSKHFKTGDQLSPEGKDRGVGMFYLPMQGYVIANPNGQSGLHRKDFIESLFYRHKISKYMYFDDGENCKYIGCPHGWFHQAQSTGSGGGS